EEARAIVFVVTISAFASLLAFHTCACLTQYWLGRVTPTASIIVAIITPRVVVVGNHSCHPVTNEEPNTKRSNTPYNRTPLELFTPIESVFYHLYLICHRLFNLRNCI